MKSASGTRSYSQKARAESAEATGRRIVEAFLGRLLEQWYDQITLDRVAEDAGVTVQTVVRRFGGKEGLLSVAVNELASRINANRAMPSGDTLRIVESLMRDYEQTGDAVIRLLALEPRYPALKEVMDFGRAEHRRWIAGAFREALSPLGIAARERALDALVVAADVYTWKILRRDMGGGVGRGVGEAAATIASMLDATIAQFQALERLGEW